MAAKIPGAARAEIPGVYHHVILDAPQAFVAHVGGFLSG